MKNGWKRRLGAGLLMMLLLGAVLASAAGFPEAASGLLTAAGRPGEAVEQLVAVSGAEASAKAQLRARSRKKKKNTATPTGSPVVTPAPAGYAESRITPTPEPEGPIIDPQSIADYLFAHGELPDNFLTKKEARALGWDSSRNYVSDVAPGMSIGGDRFGNYEGLLPQVKGRQYYEADCWYTGGKRNAYRIIYSDDGHVWYTEDHYQTFTELFPTVPAMTSAP